MAFPPVNHFLYYFSKGIAMVGSYSTSTGVSGLTVLLTSLLISISFNSLDNIRVVIPGMLLFYFSETPVTVANGIDDWESAFASDKIQGIL